MSCYCMFFRLYFRGELESDRYGSTARNQAVPASDIDLLVLLSQPFDYFVELHQIIELLYPIKQPGNLFRQVITTLRHHGLTMLHSMLPLLF